MFEELIKEICDLANDYLLTPLDLVENARLENYKYIKYYTKKDYLICEMKFEVSLEKYIFYYYFDTNNKLQQIYGKKGKIKKLYFDRKNTVEEKIIEYKKAMIKCKIS